MGTATIVNDLGDRKFLAITSARNFYRSNSDHNWEANVQKMDKTDHYGLFEIYSPFNGISKWQINKNHDKIN